MTDLADFTALVPGDHGLCVVSTLRSAGTIQSSVVNAGVLAHPVTGASVVAFTTRAGPPSWSTCGPGPAPPS